MLLQRRMLLSHQGAQESFLQSKHWISITLLKFLRVSPVYKKKISTNLRELGGTTENYFRSKYLIKNSC